MHFSCSQAITCFSVRDRTVNDQLTYLIDQDDKRLHDIELANRSVTDKMKDIFSKINFKNLSSGYNFITTYFKMKFKQFRNYLTELMDGDVVHDSDNEDDDDDDNADNADDIQDDTNLGDDDNEVVDDQQIDDESNNHESKVVDSNVIRDDNDEDKNRSIVEVESGEIEKYDNEVINFNDEFNDSIR